MIVGIDDYDRAFGLALEALRKGELIVYPTDTLYGLGADATSEKAVERAKKAKGRDDKKPISIMCSGLAMVEKYCEVSEKDRNLMANMLPGPFTVILKSKGNLPENLGAKGTIGVRVPRYFFLLGLLKECGFPITGTSANVSGGKEPCSLADVSEEVRRHAKVIIDGGACFHSAPSTVVDMTGKEPNVLRQGAGKFPPEKEFDPSIV